MFEQLFTGSDEKSSSLASSRGLSEYWRRTKSTLEALELANALRSLRKVVGYVGANVKAVEWSGMSGPEGDRILIDVAPAMGEYPIPSGKMDVLVGVAVHEALHCREWSDWVWLDVESKLKDVFPRRKVYLRTLVNVGEDVCVDDVAKRDILGNYVQSAREWYRPAEPIDFSGSPNSDALFQIWRRTALGKEELQRNMPSDYAEALQVLFLATIEILDINNRSSSVAERASKRSDLYVAVWEALTPFLVDWERREIQRIVASRKKQLTSREVVYEGFTTEEVLSPQVAREVSEILASSADDVTPLLEAEFTKPEPQALRTIFKEATKPAAVITDYRLVVRLRRIFQEQWARTLRVDRGLISGRVDGRRLYRSATTGRIFRRRDHPMENVWGITVLLDASLSMGMGSDWQLAQSTCAALYKALYGYKNRLEVLAYHEDHDVCRVHRLFHHGEFFTVSPCGRTPSGQAIMIGAMKMPESKRKLLIHVTDGECNCGTSVGEALDFCQRNKVEVVTLGFGSDKELVKEQYGENTIVVDSIQDMPQALEALLKTKLLRG